MKKRIDEQTTKSYQPHSAIISLIGNLSQYKWDAAHEGIIDKKRKRYLDKEKSKVLDQYVFPSMANIAYFFIHISETPELIEVFEKDIKDLLGVRRKNPQEQKYGYIFFKLMYSILLIAEGTYDESGASYKDFRLRLNHILQEIVWAKVDSSLTKVFKNPSAQQVVAGDFNRVYAWTRMLAESVDQTAEDNAPAHRYIKFWYDDDKI
jgi:hypothetical protein